MLIVSVFLPQTELLPHCSDVPPLARVVQEDGKLLIQAVLEVRRTTLQKPFIISLMLQLAVSSHIKPFFLSYCN